MMNKVSRRGYVVWANRNRDGSVAEIGVYLKGAFFPSPAKLWFQSMEAGELTLETAPREHGGKWLPAQPLTVVKDGPARWRFDKQSLHNLGYLAQQDTFEAMYKRDDRCPPWPLTRVLGMLKIVGG